jgi:hypothetical protein
MPPSPRLQTETGENHGLIKVLTLRQRLLVADLPAWDTETLMDKSRARTNFLICWRLM